MKLEEITRRVQGPGLCKCGCGRQTRLARETDYRSPNCIKGQPLDFARGHWGRRSAQTDRERFDDHVYPDPNTGCFMWAGKTSSKNGYGLFRVMGRLHFAHRIAYLFEHGEIADGLLVRHTCDTPWCVNSDHLIPGTVGDNALDMAKRNRGRGGTSGLPRGVRKQSRGKGYQARAPIPGKGATKSLGTFPTIEEAAAVAAAARAEIYGIRSL